MGAVRNSNTRASHASVEAAGQHTDGTGGKGSGGTSDSPHLATDGTDRRSSFSYLRRASERRRRLRMMERQDEDVGSPRHYAERQQQYPRGSESGLESEPLRKDSSAALDGQGMGEQHRLRRSHQIYDREADEFMSEDQQLSQQQEDQARGGQYFARTRQQPQQNDGQRRQSINDRLTEAVSDVMVFVREESVRRGKRHSFHRRRQAAAGGYSAGSAGGHSLAGSGGAGAGTEAELESESVLGSDRSAQNYRRRRIMRRSPRRSAQQRVYNDSDTGSMASITHDQMNIMDQQRHLSAGQQRYKLQQHGGSVQDARLFNEGPHTRMGLLEQHRRHQSADAGDSMFYPHHHQRGSDTDYAHIHNESDRDAAGLAIQPIQVGMSPPPMIASADAKLVAARRKREEDLGVLADDDEETAIHVGPDPAEKTSKSQSPIRFIAPKVVPLNSPSAMLMPDEEIVPPDVPFRGRRLPQIPGSGIIKTAADFLHSSIYGRPDRGSAGTVATAAGNAAATPLVVASSRYRGSYSVVGDPGGELVFPSVSESPTIKIDTPVPPHPGVVKRQPLQIETAGLSREGSGSINFPRVSFSPTHETAPKYHQGQAGSSTGASMIATQASGGGTQSTVLTSSVGPSSDPMIAERGSLAWARGASGGAGGASVGRCAKKDDEDDWF